MTLKHNLTKLMKANTARNDYQNMIFFVGLASCGSPASRYTTPGKKNSFHCWYYMLKVFYHKQLVRSIHRLSLPSAIFWAKSMQWEHKSLCVFLNGPTPVSFRFIFGLFKQTSLQLLQQINVKKCHVHPV